MGVCLKNKGIEPLFHECSMYSCLNVVFSAWLQVTTQQSLSGPKAPVRGSLGPLPCELHYSERVDSESIHLLEVNQTCQVFWV